METDNLEYFLKLSQLRNITKAAEALHISQPTLSRRIKALEDEFELDLFTRGKHYMELTPAGERFLEECEIYLAQKKKLLADFDALRDTTAISVGYNNGISVEPLMEFIVMAKHMTGCGFRIVTNTDRHNFKSFMKGELKCLYTSMIPSLETDGVAALILRYAGLSISLSSEHSLWNNEYVELDKLKEQTICVLDVEDDRIEAKQRFLGFLVERGFDLNNVYHCQTEEEALLYIATGKGIYLHGSMEGGILHSNKNFFKEIPVTGVSDDIKAKYVLLYKEDDEEMKKLITSINVYNQFAF